MAYYSQDHKSRRPPSISFQPTPNSLLASDRYQAYTDPHATSASYNHGYGGGSNTKRQSQYRDDPRLSRHDGYEYDTNDDKPLRPLYYEQGEDRDEAFDVRADFDGDGPRWSEMYGTGKGDPRNYEHIDRHVPSASYSAPPKSAMDAASREELVSVPVLGPEWQKSELHELSRRGKSEVRAEKRQRIWSEWVRDQRGICGIRWLTRKALVIVFFVLLVGTGLVLFFTIPRPPAFTFYVPEPFSVNNATVQFARVPANFSFTGNLNILGEVFIKKTDLSADTSNSYLPLQFSDIQVNLYHLTTNKQIASGNFGRNKVAKGSREAVVIPVQFEYSALNTTDTTWNDIYSACGHIWSGTNRPPLRLRLVLRSSIVGLVTHPETSTQISDVVCPFELPSNSV